MEGRWVMWVIFALVMTWCLVPVILTATGVWE